MRSTPHSHPQDKKKSLQIEEATNPVFTIPASQEALFSALNDVPVAMLLCDAQGIIIANNSDAQRLLRRTDLIGCKLLDLFARINYLDGSDFTSRQCPVQVAIQQRRRIENVLLECAGSQTDELLRVFLNAAPKFSAANSLQFVSCSLQEVSHFEPIENAADSQFLQKAIHQAQKEWRSTVDALSELIFLESADGRLLRCNKAAADFFHLSYQEILARKLPDLFFGPMVASVLQNPFRKGKTEVQFPGREGWYEVISYEISKEQGQASGWVHIVRDISSHKEAAAKLHQLNTVIEQTAEGILIADSTGIIQYVNPAYETITGWTREEATGRHFLTLGGQTAKLAHYNKAIDALLSGQPWRNTDKARRKDGTPYEEEITISPVRDNNGSLLNYVAICRDITEKKRLESIAEAVNMMENVGFIFSGIRHELGNPINSVKIALSVLVQYIDQWPSSQIITYLNRILSEIARVEYLLKALKTFSLHENPDMQKINLVPFLKKFIMLVEGDFTVRGIKITSSLNSNLIGCKADPRALHQVLLNLFANAADALTNRQNPTISVSAERAGKMVNIKVTDNGIGMDEAQQKNLFKPFYTSKDTGTGLGLVIVKKMMVKMNGLISIKSKPQVGTEVSLLLEKAEVE